MHAGSGVETCLNRTHVQKSLRFKSQQRGVLSNYNTLPKKTVLVHRIQCILLHSPLIKSTPCECEVYGAINVR